MLTLVLITFSLLLPRYSNMPNQPSPKKQIIGARISRELYHKVETLAKRHKLPISKLLVIILEKETRDIELTPEQHEQIAQEIRAARAGASPRQSINQGKAARAGKEGT